MTENSTASNGSASADGSPGPEGHRLPGLMDWYDNLPEKAQRLVANVILERGALISALTDQRRNLDQDCGYPEGYVQAQTYQQLFDRESIAARVVEAYPLETWQVQPTVYEDEDPSTETEFEKAWDGLGKALSAATGYYKAEMGSVVWEYLSRADVLSGIGQYGVILLGLDDGKDLSEPAEFVGPPPPWMQDSAPDATPQQDRPGGPGPTGGADVPPPGVLPAGTADIGTGMGRPSGGQPLGYPVRNVLGEGYTQALSILERVFQTNHGAVAPSSQVEEVTTPPAPALKLTTNAPARPKPAKRRLVFLRVFPETMATIASYDVNPASPRFGQPVEYVLTFLTPTAQGGGGMATLTTPVHWTRCIHVADNLGSSEVFGTPRQQQVLNRLLDLRKLYGGSAEMYWRGAFPGYSIETLPQLGTNVEIDQKDLRDQMYRWANGLQRYVQFTGMSMKGLSPQVVDPTGQINTQLEAICIKIGVPKRIFMGSERGELASTQDEDDWNDKLEQRQDLYVTPRIIVPFVDRLIALGVLPPPTEGYLVEWPGLSGKSESQQATIGGQRTTALVAYAGQPAAPALMAPMDFFTRIMGFTEDEAQTIVDNAEEEKKRIQAEEDAKAKQQAKVQADALAKAQAQQAKQAAVQGAQQPNGQPTGGPPDQGGNTPPAGGANGQGPGGQPGSLAAPTGNVAGNAFCATGEGGGIDPTCPPKGGGTGAGVPRPSVDDVRDHIERVRGAGATPKNVAKLAASLSTLTVRQLTELKKSLGLRVGGRKSELARKVAEQATARLTVWEHHVREARKEGYSMADLRAATRDVREHAGAYVDSVRAMLKDARATYAGLNPGKALTRAHRAFKGGDHADIAGFDVLARTMAGRHPELLGAHGYEHSAGGYDAHAHEAEQRLYDFLYAGPPKRPPPAEVYGHALDALRNAGPVPRSRGRRATDEEVPF